MSDYLWDKTGEPEEDVAQLENLLGTLRYQPRPLDIPATAMQTAMQTTAAARTRPATTFSRPRLALAASLILTLLAGAWFVTRDGERAQERLAKVEQGSPAGESKRAETATVPNPETPTAIVQHSETHAGAPGVSNKRARLAGSRSMSLLRGFDRVKPREHRTTVVTTAAAATARGIHRTGRRLAGGRQKLRPRAGENAPREEIAGGAMRWQVEQPLTAQQREATEQLMLALRLASAKLNYAQREMQEIGRAGK